jgi:hypothetical protein
VADLHLVAVVVVAAAVDQNHESVCRDEQKRFVVSWAIKIDWTL